MNKIKAFREKYKRKYGREITQKELGKLLKFTARHVQRLETGKRKITDRTSTMLDLLEDKFKFKYLS